MTAPLTVSVYQPDGTTLIAAVPRFKNARWQDELNTPGVGAFDIHLDDAVIAAHPTILAGRNVVKFVRTSDSFLEKEWRISSLAPVNVSSEEAAGRWCQVSGRGLLADAELAVVYPEILSQASASEDRAFNFASPSFASILVGAEWVAPLGVAQSADPTARGTFPKPWFDGVAKWIWSTDPTASAVIGRNWFRTTFTLGAGAEVLLEAAADNYMEVWLDGERIILSDASEPYDWKNNYQFSKTLVAGTHTIAAAVDNWALHDGANNPGGFLCTVYTTDSNGNRVTNVSRTDTTNWKVKAYGSPPGWTFGDILLAVVGEAQARGATDLDTMTFGFTGAVDSNAVAWPAGKQDRTLRIGDDLLKVVGQATELVCDVWMVGNQLNAAPSKRTDRTATAIFTAGVNVLASAPTFKGGPTRNVALVRFGYWWREIVDAVSVALYGRREVYLTLGGTGSSDQATAVATANFTETSLPEITIPLQCSSAVGPQLGVDFFVGDAVTGPGLFGVPAALRVMSATGTAGDNAITYDLDLYPE